jgi:hypothetical protein
MATRDSVGVHYVLCDYLDSSTVVTDGAGTFAVLASGSIRRMAWSIVLLDGRA